MDFANRGNRPVQQQQQQPAPQVSSDNSPVMPQPAKSGGRMKGLDFSKVSSVFVLFAVAIMIVALVIALIFGSKDTAGNKEADLVDTSKYQAVFLNSQDGQVYFGKLGIYNKDTYVLTDIYYVRVENPVQPEGQDQQQQANISLAKLGNELHGPQDYMYISRDQVLFWENLKDDGQVAKAIAEYKANGGEATDATQTQDTTQTQQQAADTTTQTQDAAAQQQTTTTPAAQ